MLELIRFRLKPRPRRTYSNFLSPQQNRLENPFLESVSFLGVLWTG